MGRANGVARRELLLAWAGVTTAQGQVVTVARWRAAAVYGVQIGEERWAVLEPVLERRQAQVEALRRFRVAEGVEPGGG